MARSIGSRHEAIVVNSAEDEARFAGMGFRGVRDEYPTLAIRPPRSMPGALALFSDGTKVDRTKIGNAIGVRRPPQFRFHAAAEPAEEQKPALLSLYRMLS